MKKLIATALILASAGISALAADSKTNTTTELSASNAAVAQQTGIRIRRGRRYYRPVYQRRARRVVTRTRFVGRYRETYQATYFPNGRIVTRLISRVRVR